MLSALIIIGSGWQRKKEFIADRGEAAFKGESLLEEQRLMNCLERLPKKFREIIHLRFYHELDFGEIASIMDLPLGTVYSRINRGLTKLRKIWEKGHEA